MTGRPDEWYLSTAVAFGEEAIEKGSGNCPWNMEHAANTIKRSPVQFGIVLYKYRTR